jgi:superfamily II DNA helicase RecQ
MSVGSSTVVNQSVKVLFISPERLQNKSVLKSILQLSWSCISIDEPHLALEWGLSKSAMTKQANSNFGPS